MKLDIGAIGQFWHHLVWERPLESWSRGKRLLVTSLRIVHLILRDLAEGQLTMRAMGLVYTTLLSMVPLLAVSFSVLKGFGVHNQVRPMLLKLLEPLGEKGVEITNQIIAFVDNVQVGVLGAVGLGLLFYTVISLLQKVERAFNYTWRVPRPRPLSQRVSDYLSVILIGPVLVFTAIGITASLARTSFVQTLIQHPVLGGLMDVIAHLLPYGLMTTVFAFIYVLFPNTRVQVRAAIIGGLVASILWQFTGWVFAAFVVNSAKYTAIYSVFATLIVFLIWLYLNWLIVLVGCTITFYVQHPEYRNLRPRIVRLSNRVREKLGLCVMICVARRFHAREPCWTVATLAETLNVGADIVQRIVDGLVETRLLATTADEPPCLLPASALESLTLREVLSAIRRIGEQRSITLEILPQDETVDALTGEIEAAIDTATGDRTLLDIVRDEPASAQSPQEA